MPKLLKRIVELYETDDTTNLAGAEDNVDEDVEDEGEDEDAESASGRALGRGPRRRR